MRVLVAAVPSAGHVHPMVAVAAEPARDLLERSVGSRSPVRRVEEDPWTPVR